MSPEKAIAMWVVRCAYHVTESVLLAKLREGPFEMWCVISSDYLGDSLLNKELPCSRTSQFRQYTKP